MEFFTLVLSPTGAGTALTSLLPCMLTANFGFSYSKEFLHNVVRYQRMCQLWPQSLKLQNIFGTHQQWSDFIMIGHKAAMNAGVKAFPSMSWRNARCSCNASKNSTKQCYGLNDNSTCCPLPCPWPSCWPCPAPP